MEVLQQWLIEQREKRKLTIQQLAQNLNKPVSYIHDIEQGQHILEIVEFLRYCHALEVDHNLAIEIIQDELQKQS
ncbi:hypothetical protein F900_01147 [Acinetobacter modestus]|uniref:HTH cro/C1-type domain-containing protein n=1 Tax=Acinetobacter modestus TaxID=1776740 RepID=N9NL32_9GAMM|nr:helix-turn-helix transcriptional regulator [Acinetobacter modestus]ENX02700.1 hypothetical protein F900_01147 [Acinetobacter modestus]